LLPRDAENLICTL